MNANLSKYSVYFLRFSLAGSYLSAVADRFGLWGKSGTAGVVWGNFESFTEYTGSLLFYLPGVTVPFFAWVATILEIILAVYLLVGVRLKEASIASAILLASFALSMTMAYGIKSAFDYSVLTACAASLLLYSYVALYEKHAQSS